MSRNHPLFWAMAALGAVACGPAPLAHLAGPFAAGADRPASLGVFTSDASGFDTHSWYYDTGREVVVFDAQFTQPLAEQAVAEIRAHTRSPITYVVITHPSPDKFNGAPVFQRLGAKVVASAATAAALPAVHAYKKNYFVEVTHQFTADSYPPEATVDLTFGDRLSLPLAGGATVELRRLQHAGVASDQTVAYIPARRALVVGDLIHYRTHAWLEGPIRDGVPRPDLASWDAALDEIVADYPDATVYGGRGAPAPIAVAAAEEKTYLAGMQRLVADYVAGLGARKSELAGPQAGAHYQRITALATAAYPDFALAYLIQYGVYGLVNQLAGINP